MKRADLPLTVLAAGLAVVVTAGAGAEAYSTHDASKTFYATGIVCQPAGGHAGYLDYREQGVGNMSTTAVAEVFCPTVNASDDAYDGVDWIEVDVLDASNAGAVSCYMYGTDPDRSTLWSPTKSTNTADPPSPGWWTGNAKLFFDVGALYNPNNQGGIFYGRSSWSIRCYIPQQSGSGARSWVRAITTGVGVDWTSPE